MADPVNHSIKRVDAADEQVRTGVFATEAEAAAFTRMCQDTERGGGFPAPASLAEDWIEGLASIDAGPLDVAALKAEARLRLAEETSSGAAGRSSRPRPA